MIQKPLIEYISEAILELRPGSQFTLVGDSLEKDETGGVECVRWNTGNKSKEPSRQEIISKVEELKSRWLAIQYQKKREQEYPTIGDQLDALFKAGLFPEEMAAKIQAVKDKYPKQ